MSGMRIRGHRAALQAGADGRRPSAPSQDQPADILQHVAEMPGEPGGQRAVDDPVVIGQRHGQRQPGHEFRAVPTGAILERPAPRIATSGALTIGVKRCRRCRQAGDPKTPLHVGWITVCRRGPLRGGAQLRLSSWMPLRSTSRMTGTTRPSGVSAAMPMW